MLGTSHRYRWTHGLTAACLALLLFFASLAPLAAQAFASHSSCCRTGAKCCCRKTDAKQRSGPAFSGARESCGGDCAGLAPAGVRAGGFALPASRYPATPGEFRALRARGQFASPARLSERTLQQRPPPAPPLV